MTITPFTLNPGTGGPVTPLDDLNNIDGVAAFASAKAPLAKLAWGPSGEANQTSQDRPLPVDPLARVGVARQLAAGAASANTVLTSTARRMSVFARLADVRYSIGSASQTASATSHFIAMGERLDIELPATPNIAVIRAGAVDGVLEVSELL
jgi:hypothetical protein